jgi:hypothetical protein
VGTIIDIENKACSLALKEAASLGPGARAALEQAPLDELHGSMRFRAVTVTAEDARDLLGWFQTRADGWTSLEDVRGATCARAADVIRTTLRMRGL